MKDAFLDWLRDFARAESFVVGNIASAFGVCWAWRHRSRRARTAAPQILPLAGTSTWVSGASGTLTLTPPATLTVERR